MSTQPILVVDDEANMRWLIRLYLEKEYPIVEAADGREALTKLEQEQPALVLLDVMMPQLDGWETLRHIREGSAIPVIMLTALGDTPDRMKGLRMGADDYIPKPFDGRELVARLKAVLRRSYRTQVQDDRVIVGSLAIVPEARIATVNGHMLDLTPKEFDLLLVLARNASHVMSREQLLARIWGTDYTGGTRTVDSHIRNLREKLGDNGSLIVTCWGKGYRLTDSSQQRRN